MNTLYAGVSRRVINPPLGINKIGLRLFGDPIQGIESDLTATALVLANGKSKAVIIASDLCVIPMDTLHDLRCQVGEAIDILPSHVMVNLSHNHSVPAFPGWAVDTPEQQTLKENYQDSFMRWVIEAVIEADQQLQEARIVAGQGESYIGVYRRETGPDGRDILGEVPDHPIDPTVGVIRIDDLEGHPIAILFSYGCHPVTVGPRSLDASSDFPGAAREILENNLGGYALFLQGCGGNINPAVGIGYEVDCRDTKQMVGTMLGGEALKVAASLRTHVQQGERTTLWDIPNLLFTPWEPEEGDTCTYLGAADELVKLEYGELPSLDESNRFHDKWQRTLQERQEKGSQDWEIRVASHFLRWSKTLIDAVEDGHPTHDLLIQAIRVNDIVLVGLSVEAFYETGLSIKQESPFKHTLVIGYTNGPTCYLPRVGDYPPSGWKIHESYHVPDLFVQSYNLPVALHPDSEQIAVNRATELIHRLV